MSRSNKGRVLGPNRGECGVTCDMGEWVRTPEGDDVVADDEVVGLVGAANAWEHGCCNLVLGERIRREPSCEGDEGLGVELPGETER